MNTRPMLAADLAEVLAIEQDANPYPWSRKNFDDSLKANNRGWIFINKDNKIIGFSLIQKVMDEVHLLNICVKKTEQGKGIGRDILNHVIDFAISISAILIVLEVRQSNQVAQALYLNAGFNEMSIRKRYYPAKEGREDAILMGLDLDLLSLFTDNTIKEN